MSLKRIEQLSLQINNTKQIVDALRELSQTGQTRVKVFPKNLYKLSNQLCNLCGLNFASGATMIADLSSENVYTIIITTESRYDLDSPIEMLNKNINSLERELNLEKLNWEIVIPTHKKSRTIE